MITVMILAGGVGSRVGADRPKQFIEILGKPVLAYTIDNFHENPLVDAIEIVCHKEWKQYVVDMIDTYGFSKVKWITDGGDTFQNSVINGVNCLKDKIKDDDYVLIQYAAAPFTSQKVINSVIQVMLEKDSSFSATPCFQLMGSNDGDVSLKWADRDKFVQIASPYGFKYEYLKNIYERAQKHELLDKIEPHVTSLMYALGDTLYQAYGEQANIKITTEEDLKLLEIYAVKK